MSTHTFDEHEDLERIGLVECRRDAAGRRTWILTTAGTHVGRLVTSSQDDALALLDAFLAARRRARALPGKASIATMGPDQAGLKVHHHEAG